MARLVKLLALAACPLVIFCQTFEVASIRRSGPQSVRGWDGGPGSKDPAHYMFGRVAVMELIWIAYDLQEPFQVASKTSLERDEFDLAAKVPADATKEEFRAMMRNLLAERFHLKVHSETHEFPALALVVARSGTKLGTEAATATALEPGFPQLTLGRPGLISNNSANGSRFITRIRGQQQPISMLAKFLRTAGQRPVVDQTGLTGKYDFALEFSAEMPNGAPGAGGEPAGAPDLTTALREQLGLQLIPKKVPFKIVVVESCDRFPTDN